MRRLIRVAAMATTASVVLASSLAAQTHTVSTFSNPRPVVQQRGAGAPMTFTLLGGIATGERGLDLGIVLGGSFEWDVRDWPVNLRLDPYLARHSGDCGPGDIDCDLTILGAGVNVAYHFPVTANAPQWFILGGLGLYHSSFDIDSDVFPGIGGFDDSSTDLGIQIGGGVRFGGRYRVEARFMSVENFDTIPILFGITF